MSSFKVDDKVKLIRDYGNRNEIPKGVSGTITLIDDNFNIHIQLDQHIPFLDAWSNTLIVFDDDHQSYISRI